MGPSGAEASTLIAPTMTTGEAPAEPRAARVPGVAGVRGTSDWLHAAYMMPALTPSSVQRLDGEAATVDVEQAGGSRAAAVRTEDPDRDLGCTLGGRDGALLEDHAGQVRRRQLSEGFGGGCGSLLPGR
jgi:hypothetical protein